jgi:hypothetical protein
MRRDRIANEKVIDFFAPTALTAGTTYYSSIFDTMRVSVSQNNRENITNLLLQISIQSGWSATGTLTCFLQHCVDGLAGSMVTYATLALMGGMESEDLYLAEIKDFNRYIRLGMTPATANVTLCALGVGNRSRREPVVQLGREKAVTYNSNPITN